MLDVYHKRNVAIHLIDGGSFYVGASLCSFSVIVPAFVQKYTSSAILLMLVPFINEFGMYAFQSVSVYLGHKAGRQNAIKLYFLFEFIHRFSFIVIGAAIMISQKMGANPLTAFFVAYALSNIAWGFGMPQWNDAVTLTVPDGIRAKFLGQREFWTRVIGVVASFFAPLIFGLGTFPLNYAYLFLIGGFIFTVGMLPVPKFVNLFPFADDKDVPLPKFGAFVKEGVKITFGNKNLRVLLLFCLLMIASRITYAYMTPYIIRTVIWQFPVEARDGWIAILNTVQVVSMAAMAYVMGMLLHRLSYKAAVYIAIGCMIVLNATILLFHSLAAAFIAQIFYGLFTNLSFFIPMNAIMDATKPEKRSLAFASYNLAFLVALGVFSAAGTLIAKYLSMAAALWITAGMFGVIALFAIRLPAGDPIPE